MASVTLPWPRMSNIRQHRLCQEASPSVESAAHVLAGLTCFILLPLFHFQLFFFLLESMGGNGFVACLCWALVPSVTTRVGRLRSLARLHLRFLQAIAAICFTASLAAGAAGFVTLRLAISSVGLAVSWGGCQASQWGGRQGRVAMDGLIAGNHLSLLLHLLASALPPPSPDARFLRSLPLPALLLLGLLVTPPPSCYRPGFCPWHCPRWWSIGRGRRYFRVSANDVLEAGGGDGRGGGGDVSGGGSVRWDRAVGSGRGDGGRSDEGGDHAAANAAAAATTAAAPAGTAGAAAAPPAGVGGKGVELVAAPPRHRVAGATSVATTVATTITARTDATTRMREDGGRETQGGHEAGARGASRTWTSAVSEFLRNLAASACFGALLFLTMLLAGSPLTGEDWNPSPSFGVVWSVLRRASVTLAWGFGRALIPAELHTTARAEEANSESGVARYPGRFCGASPYGKGVAYSSGWSGVLFRTTAQPAVAMVCAVAAIALCPERACVVVPAMSTVALTLPSLWEHLETFTSEGAGNDGAAVYIILIVWETALVAFEYAPPLRPLRSTRGALMIASAVMAAAPSLLFSRLHCRGIDGSGRVRVGGGGGGDGCVGVRDGGVGFRGDGGGVGGVGGGGVGGGGGGGGCGDDCGGVGGGDDGDGDGGGCGIDGSRGGGGAGANEGGGDGVGGFGSGFRGGGGGGGSIGVGDWVFNDGELGGGGGGGGDGVASSLSSSSSLSTETCLSKHSTATTLATIAITIGLAFAVQPTVLSSSTARARGDSCAAAVQVAADNTRSDGIQGYDMLSSGTRRDKLLADEMDGAAIKLGGVISGLRLVNFNVYMGYDRLGEDNTFRVGKLLRELGADVAVLQETGLMRLTLGNRRYAGAVAAAAGMFVAAAAPVPEDTWGCAIVSRLPVLRWGWRRLPRGSGENACEAHATVSLGEGRGTATVVNVHLGNQDTQDNHDQVTGLLSLLEDLSEDDHVALALSQGRGRRLRRARQHLTLNSGVLADGRGGVSVAGEGGGERRLLIVAGDFNFNSTSVGYRRLVEDGGLQSAVGASLLSANCSGSSSRCRRSSGGGGGGGVGGANRRGIGIGIGGGPGGGSSSATSNSGVSSSRSDSDSSNSGDSFGTPVPFGIGGEGNGMERVLTLREAVAMGEKNDAEREEYDGGFGDGGDGDGHGDDHGDDDGGGDGDGIGDDGEKIDSDGDGDDGGGSVAVGGHVHLLGADVDVDGDVDGGGGVDIDSDDDGDEDGDRDDDSVGEEAPLDFVFFSLGPGAYLEAYEVHREFSQERYADGYPSVTDFGVRCPLLPF